ncbi:endonuclease/exonuclease/phosphatase family protein [Phyllobacterium endophyticum]|uniref:Hydrolase n=1 Tax=Phyllobacterium endophyticum TaxID=1149773 RepID=A0A2P7AQU7_9HYPH|nr:endonuclease/exonuclease/phosphatase family protein [Phyllobacterium endophyticum]MBB3237225.1 endonuclease/exonuclease/phosphatase family metal-dependent hydrolase [Phyllobacterium endophyticum]PSH56604.1 hydrolase [Phyllobacterium endophyticum]TYR44402.1 hydrolase [Phyllobacterium endophyticum]
MKIISYNIQFSLGRNRQYDIEKIADTIRGGDIIALQEVERLWDRSGNVDQPAELARLLPNHFVAFGATIDILKGGYLQDGAADNRRRQFGNMILSRYPILTVRNHLYPKFGALEQHSIQRGAIEATIETPLGLIRVYSTHLCHLSPRQRGIQIQRLLEVNQNAPSEGSVDSGVNLTNGWNEKLLPAPPTEAILLGDFNLESTECEYDLIVGPMSAIPNRETQRLNGFGTFVDAWVAAGHDERSGVTLFKDVQAGIGPRIDYCFVTPGLAKRVKAAHIDAEADGSDHQPLHVEMASE